MDALSQQILVDIVFKEGISNEDIVNITEVIEKNFNVIKKVSHRFEPHGETIVFILAESHFVLHTYPEQNYISLDIYACNSNINLESIVYSIKEKINTVKVETKLVTRGSITQVEQNQKIRLLYFLTVMIAMGSILYELLLAQSLSTTMGNTALRYNVTIGIYIAAMGFGALFYSRLIKEKDLIFDFIKIEILLSVVGGFSPVLVLFFDFAMGTMAHKFGINFHSSIIQIPIFIFNHFLILLIGFISGLELPLLINIGKKISKKTNNQVLAFDYFGTLIGAILFPLLLLPSFNLFLLGFIVSFLNIFVSAIVSIRLQKQNRKIWALIFSVLLVWILLIFNSETVARFIINNFYFGGKI
jgi:S-adenosylmethionine/arginine decarboxylase-like enzyme